MKHKRLGLYVAMLASSQVSAELQQLDDSVLSGIDGQSGLSLDMKMQMSIGEIAYFDDGNSLQIQGIKLGNASDINQKNEMHLEVDVEADGSLVLGYDIKPTRLLISDIRLDDDLTSSFGSYAWDFAISGQTKIHSEGLTNPSLGGAAFDVSYALTDGRFVYHTNGNEIFFDDVSITANAPGIIWEPSESGTGLDIRVPSYVGTFNIGGIRFASGSDTTLVDYNKAAAAALPSFGSFSGDFDLSASYHIEGGGRFGTTGIRIDSQHVINSMNWVYNDDGNELAFRGITGWYTVDDMRIDVASDTFGDKALALTFGQVSGEFNVGSIEAGGRSFGSMALDFNFADQVVDGTTYTNQFFIKGGGNANAGSQGLSIDAMWSLADSNLSYTDDGNTVIFSGLKSYGHGTVTVDVTSAGVLGGEEFFDGLRIGFEDFQGSYKIDGLRVGDENANLQGGTELLLALGVYPAYDFNINGHATLGAGGQSGSGLTINSDIYINNGNAALMVDENGRGVWATNLQYDIHLRDLTVDIAEVDVVRDGVTERVTGIQIVKGEAWSSMDIGDLKVGSKDDDKSFGRFVLDRYEVGSTMTISPGGHSSRGPQGITVNLKQIFAEAVPNSAKRNRFMWETNRSGGNGTGMKLIFDNITTNDGNGSNTYGFRNDINIDVAETDIGSGTALGFAVQAHTHFKELNVGSVQFQHGNSAPETGIHGLSLQNFSINSNLTATPID